MAHRFGQTLILFFATLFSVSFCLAGGSYDASSQDSMAPNLEFQNDSGHFSPYSNKTLYIFTDYLFTHRFLTNSLQTVINPAAGTTVVNLVPKDVLPKNAHGFELGLGNELSKHIDLQIAYVQQFKQTKNATITAALGRGTTSLETKGALVDVAYVLSRSDKFQMVPDLGITIADVHETVRVAGSDYTPPDLTEISPTVGLTMLYRVTEDFALRLGVKYAISTYDEISNGEISGFAGLSLMV